MSGEFRSHHLDQVKAEISRGEPIAPDSEEVDLAGLFVDGGFAQVSPAPNIGVKGRMEWQFKQSKYNASA
jgi:hypothetical protein